MGECFHIAAAGILHIMAFFFSFPFIFRLIPARLCGLYDRSKSLMPWRLDSPYSPYRVGGNLFSRPFYHAESINDIPPRKSGDDALFNTHTHTQTSWLVNCRAHRKNINSPQKTFENPAIFFFQKILGATRPRRILRSWGILKKRSGQSLALNFDPVFFSFPSPISYDPIFFF